MKNALTTSLGLLCVGLLLLLVQARLALSKTESDIRLARDLAWSFRDDRNLAIKGDISQVPLYLEKLGPPIGPSAFGSGLDELVEVSRTSAVREIIAFLRSRSGKDYGDNPLDWIKAIESGEVKAKR